MDDVDEGEHPGPPVVAWQNRVAIGPGGLVEDSTPSYLGTRPIASCPRQPGCKIPGTEVWSGATFVAVCRLSGDAITNADLALLTGADHRAGAR